MIEQVWRLDGVVVNIGPWDDPAEGAVMTQEEVVTAADGARYPASHPPRRSVLRSLVLRRMTGAERAALRTLFASPGQEDVADLWEATSVLYAEDPLLVAAAAPLGISPERVEELLAAPTETEIANGWA